MNTNKFCSILLPLGFAAALITGATGCAGLLMGGAATGAAVANDPRTTGTVVEDQAIEVKAAGAIRGDAELNQQTHINTTSYNQIVLLTGQAPTEAMRSRIFDMVKGIEKVRHVHNEITIAAPSPVTSRTNDGWLTTNVKTKLFANKELNATKIKVVTEAGTVYLMGLASQTEGDLAAEIASQTSGVQRVVKLFEYK